MNMQIRQAAEADHQRIFDWRNDPVTISTSRSGEGLNRETLLGRISNSETTWLIGECDGEPFGVVWLTRGRSGVYESSIILSPAHRGRKLSGPLLTQGMAWIRARRGASPFAAEIKDTNIPSIRIFESRNFVYVHPTPGGFGVYCTVNGTVD